MEWKRQRGRPRRTWVQQIEDDTGLNANDAGRIAHDHKSWRVLWPVAGQAFHWLTDWLTAMLNQLCTPDFDTVVNKKIYILNSVLVCFKKFFICTLNALCHFFQLLIARSFCRKTVWTHVKFLDGSVFKPHTNKFLVFCTSLPKRHRYKQMH